VLTPIVSGWEVNNTMSVFSGFPFSVTGDCDPAWPGNSPTMINTVGSPKKIGSKSGYWYDPFAFAQTYDPNDPGTCLAGSLGTSGFYNLRGPGTFNWDFGLFRDFAITERIRLQFRAEAFNFTNTPHFGGTVSSGHIPDNAIGDANSIDPKTGRVIDPGAFLTPDNGVNDLAREGIDERQFRLGLRIQF
jgi:hypothetical protein